MKPERTVLALNVGSANLKAVRFAFPLHDGHGSPEVRETGRVQIEASHAETDVPEERARRLISGLVERMPGAGEAPDAIVHRIVHGEDRDGPSELTPAELASLDALSALAPLHQAPALALVRAAIGHWPRARQFGAFDTSWHRTMPEKHRMFALPRSLYAQGVRRYGFHGLAFQSALRLVARVVPDRRDGRIVLAHLGGGSSLSAVRGGHCVSTTMGMTPLGGLPMATRSGSLDPGVLLYLQRNLAMSPDEIDRLLWHDSGVRGLSGESGDMRRLLASESDDARRAVEAYVASVAQGIAAMAACIGGLDVLAFSGGIGQHATAIRERIAGELGWMGLDIDPDANRDDAIDISTAGAPVKTLVLPVDEAREMAQAVTSSRFWRSSF